MGKNRRRKAIKNDTNDTYWEPCKHADNEWIRSKIGGHGGSHRCTSDPESLATIGYIGGKNGLIGRIQILWYNTILLYRYMIRQIRNRTNR